MNYNVVTMLFIWDPLKAEANLKKHGVSFDLAVSVFNDPFHLSVTDGKSSGEERWVTIGLSADASTLIVIHLFKDTDSTEVIRIISARKATRKEKKQYEEGI